MVYTLVMLPTIAVAKLLQKRQARTREI